LFKVHNFTLGSTGPTASITGVWGGSPAGPTSKGRAPDQRVRGFPLKLKTLELFSVE